MTLVIGRGAELDVLGEAARDGRRHPSAMLLRGEPGVGKTWLLDVACAWAMADNIRVIRAVGLQSETHLPFAALHQLLRPVLAQAAALPQRQWSALQTAFGMSDGTLSDSFLVGLATLELVGLLAEEGPVTLVVDDIQWLDAPTADVLAFVARRFEAEPVTLLMVIRNGHDSPLLTLGLPELVVAELDDAAAAELLDATSPGLDRGRRDGILVTAAGNPLAIVELPNAKASPDEAERHVVTVPMTERLERSFASRVVNLPAAARTLLLLAAANDSELLTEVLSAGDFLLRRPGAALEHLDSLVAADLLHLDHPQLHFRHPLMRSATYRSASAADLRTAHAALADVVSNDSDRRAWHLGIATLQPGEHVASELEAAAKRALGRGATTTTVAVLQRASELSPSAGPRNRRMLEAAELALQVGDPARALQLAERTNNSALDRHQQRRLRLLREVVHTSGDTDYGRFGVLIALAEEAARGADTDLALGFLQLAALQLWVTDQGRDARVAVLEAAQRIAPDAYDPRVLGIIGFTDPEGQGRLLRQRVANLQPDSLDPESALQLGSAINLAGAFDLSAALLATAVDGFREAGRVNRLPEALCHQTWTALHRLDWTLALPSVEEASRYAEETRQPIWKVSAQIAEGLLVGLRGDADLSEALCSEAESVAAPLGARAMLSGIQITRGITCLGSAQYERAYHHLRRMFDPTDPVYHHYQSFWAIGDLTDAALHTGRLEEAREIFVGLQPSAESTAATWLQVGLAYAEPLLANDDQAERLYRTALGSVLAGWPLYRARMHLEFGRWLRRQRRVIESREPLRAATQSFDALGVRSFGALARQELRAAGEASRDVALEPWAVLSPQELHIARLAAEGLSNREIGERLYLSHRTVGSHLYRIFPKLNITSRAQLRDRLQQG